MKNVSVACRSINSNLDTKEITLELDFINKQIGCHFHNGTILIFPIDDLRELQIYHRSLSEIYLMQQIKDSFEEKLSEMFEIEPPRETIKPKIRHEDEILLLIFDNGYELSIILDTVEELNDLVHHIKKLIRHDARRSVKETCLNLCVGEKTKIGLLSRLLCIRRPVDQIPEVPFLKK